MVVVDGQGEKRKAGAFALQTFFVQRGRRTSRVRRLSMDAREQAMQRTRGACGGLTWFCALLLHDLNEGHRGRCNEAPTLPALGLTLGPVPKDELDLGLVVYVMPTKVRNTGEIHGKCDTQVHDLSLIRVLAVYSEQDFVLMLTVDLYGDDRSPGLFGTQHSQVLGPEHWRWV